MQTLKRLLALLVCSAFVAWAQGNSFDKVRYNGGSVDSKVDPKDWNNHLTIASDLITLALKDGKKLEIPPKSVTSLSYGQEAHGCIGHTRGSGRFVRPISQDPPSLHWSSVFYPRQQDCGNSAPR